MCDEMIPKFKKKNTQLGREIVFRLYEKNGLSSFSLSDSLGGNAANISTGILGLFIYVKLSVLRLPSSLTVSPPPLKC